MSRTLALVLALVPAAAFAQSVEVEVSSRSITEEEEVQVTFTFSGRGEGQLPEFRPDWNVSGRSQSVNTRIINGRMYQERSETIVLTPTRSGTLVVPAARLLEGGSLVASSAPVPIVVRGVQPMRPSDARKEENIPGDALVLVPELDRDVYYLGEPFVVTMVLYVQRGSRITQPDIDELRLPEAIQREDVLKGRVQEDGPNREMNGRTYARVPIFREVWKVLRAESLTVPGLKVTVDLPSRDFFSSGRRLKLRSPPLTLEVRPVPAEGRPPGYREGTIGNFKVSSSIQADEEHGRALYEVTVEGSGSLATIEAPVIQGVTGAQVKPLPAEDRDQITVDANGVSGRRVFQYLVTPERTGTVFLPPVRVVAFDPSLGRYTIAESEALTWVASKAAGSTRRSAVGVEGQSEGAPELHPIESDSALDTIRRTPLHRTPWFLGTVTVPLLAFLGLETSAFIRRRRQAGSGQARVRRALATAQKHLRDAGQGADAFATIARALRGYVEDRHGLVLTGMTNDAMRAALAGLGYPTAVVEALIAELESCDFARFAPGGGVERDAALQRSAAILTDMEKHVA